MQVVRLRSGGNRTVWQKLFESFLAVRLECTHSKNSIIALYASNAPFGSNVVGLDAAAWRYFGRSPDKLSWGEMAALAVLPNSPALVHPGKNQPILLRKRNRLIDKLVQNKTIDSTTGTLAKMEILPGRPLSLPQLTPHLLDRYKKEYGQLEDKTAVTTRITTTVRAGLQQNITQIVNRYNRTLSGNGINNLAAIVLENETGNVLGYVGNIYNPGNAELESHVDILASVRSPGSTLKPLLFAAMQTDGLLLPRQLVPDIPTQIGGYTPKNFHQEYDGAVPANNALSRSLNIPAVKMLQQYQYQRFYDLLKQCGFSTLKQPADFYGLSLILGGCEVSPWELAGMYSSLARSYNRQWKNQGGMRTEDWHMPVYINPEKKSGESSRTLKVLAPGDEAKTPVKDQRASSGIISSRAIPFDYTAIWHTLNAMQEVMRPGEEGLWNLFNSAERIAWKTGTSFGFRDGWSIGLTPKYCVLVWAGNADGEGRPELTGINTAAPLMFDIFRLLPTSPWFQPPGYDFTYIPVCHQSGYKAGAGCPDADTVFVSVNGKNGPTCPFHQIIHLDHTGTVRVSEACELPANMVTKSWFILPPAMEFYYKVNHQDYQPLPAYKQGCPENPGRQMELIYPEENARIYVPVEISGEKGKTIFTATHRNPDARLFWHLDHGYMGTTRRYHQYALNPLPGVHWLTVVDEQGETITRRFEIVEKEGY